jgi:hypothetical protein
MMQKPPSPEEIRVACLEIQAAWTREDWLRRKGYRKMAKEPAIREYHSLDAEGLEWELK